MCTIRVHFTLSDNAYKDTLHMWQMQSDVQRDFVFIEAPPFPLLWFAGGVYYSSRWHHCPGWGEKKRCVKILHRLHPSACLHLSTHTFATEFQKPPDHTWHILQLLLTVAVCCIGRYLDTWPLCCLFVCLFVVCSLAEAEHGYASMPPFTSSQERESLKRKSKSKKNTSSR